MYRNSKLHVNDPVNMHPIHKYIQVYILLERLKKKKRSEIILNGNKQFDPR